MAALVYAKGRGSRQSRLLAALLVLEGAAVGVTFAGSRALLDPRVAYGARGVEFVAQIAALFLYLAFLGTLASPLSRPFRGPWARLALYGAAAMPLFLWPLLSGAILTDELVAPSGGPFADAGGVLRASGPGADVVDVASAGVLLFGLAVAVDALRRAPRGSPARPRAAAYALAFGVRDGLLATGLLLSAARNVLPSPEWTRYYTWFSITLGLLVFVLLLAYGMLRTHLFDVDLRIKWTLRRSTVAAAFVALFFVASESTAAFLGDRWGTYFGIAAAGALLFALAPLSRLAERVSDAAMPHVQDTEEYRTVRKREVYRAAVESALEDGAVTERERAVLAALADQLGLSATEALRVERDAARGAAESLAAHRARLGG